MASLLSSSSLFEKNPDFGDKVCSCNCCTGMSLFVTGTRAAMGDGIDKVKTDLLQGTL